MAFLLRHTDLRIQAERAWMDALLSHSPDVRGLILCVAPWFGRLRESREDYAATALRDAGFATLLVSLLTPYEEARDPELRYDVSLMGQRLQALLTWIDQQPQLADLPLGALGVGTVVSALIRTTAREETRIAAMVSRAGRADMAGAEPLRRLNVPLLMIMPGQETALKAPGAQAFALVSSYKRWEDISQASMDFIEPGTLEAASMAARRWFEDHLPLPVAPVEPEATE